MNEQPQTNGPSAPARYIDTIDPEDPEYIRQMRRPAEIKEDVKQMEARKRVSLILNSQAFRDELEHIVNEQIQKGPLPASLVALQQMQELVLPQSKMTQDSNFVRPSAQIMPINDIRGVDSLNYSKGEKLLRCKTAATFRLLDVMGWAHGLQNHITGFQAEELFYVAGRVTINIQDPTRRGVLVRISQSHEHFLVQPTGMLYHEVTAASLLKVDMRGEMLDPGSSTLTLNKEGFSLHAAIHASRPDVKAIIHLQSPAAASVAAMKCGLIPMSREAMVLGEISYYDYAGAMVDQEEKDVLTRQMGPMNKVLVLRNNGILALGESIDEAFFFAKHIMAAVDAQIKTMPIGLENISLPSEEIQKKIHEEAMNAHLAMSGDGEGDNREHKRKWRRGEQDFEALMRHLDNMGFRTGYVFREPLLRADPRRDRANADVEVPPSSTSLHYFDEDGVMRTPAKVSHHDLQKKMFKTDWLATPNAYQREEIEETGTPTPKKITKWVGAKEGHNSPIKVDSPQQFVPLGTNPKELREKHRAIRQDYYTERVSAGPQSRILEGMTWEEAQRIKDGHVSGTADSVIVVGAASKGIIQRDHQHNQVVYKTYYASNPFDSMTEDEITKYKHDIEKKGEPAEETLEPGPDGKLISTDERMQQVRQQTEEVAQQEVPSVAPVAAPPPTSEPAESSPAEPAPGQDKPMSNSSSSHSSNDPTSERAGGVYPQRQYLETSLDDLTEVESRLASKPPKKAPGVAAAAAAPQETSIDDVTDPAPQPPSPTHAATPSSPDSPPADFKRTLSARYPPQKSPQLVEELHRNFERSKSERRPKKKGANGDQGVASSPAKSTSSGDFERSSKEGSPTKEVPQSQESPSKGEKKKKKKFRMPSFSKKKDKKEKE